MIKFVYILTIVALTTVCGTSDQLNDKNVGGESSSSANAINAVPNQICEPNAVKMKVCNRCRCSPNGLHWLCTRKLCLNLTPRAKPNDEDFVCTPNKVFKYECNTCTCNASGNGANCTELSCDGANENIQSLAVHARLLPTTTQTTTTPPPPSSSSSSSPLLSSDECVPGARWRQDCNICFCTSTKIAACTLRGCAVSMPNIPIINQLRGGRERRQVINQNQWAAGKEGEKVYTFNDLNDPNFTCTPSYSFKLDCNTCWCAADGRRPRFCTRIACNPKTYPPANSPKVI